MGGTRESSSGDVAAVEMYALAKLSPLIALRITLLRCAKLLSRIPQPQTQTPAREPFLPALYAFPGAVRNYLVYLPPKHSVNKPPGKRMGRGKVIHPREIA